jgi:hypothetical protein
VLAISIGEFKEITPGKAQVEPEEQEALEKVKARRPRLRLDAIGIKPGDVFSFSRDESIHAIVAADGKVEYEGELLSPSAAAARALHKLGYQTPSVSGSEYWMFQGETLDERRRRMEAEQFDQPRNDAVASPSNDQRATTNVAGSGGPVPTSGALAESIKAGDAEQEAPNGQE